MSNIENEPNQATETQTSGSDVVDVVSTAEAKPKRKPKTPTKWTIDQNPIAYVDEQTALVEAKPVEETKPETKFKLSTKAIKHNTLILFEPTKTIEQVEQAERAKPLEPVQPVAKMKIHLKLPTCN